MGYFGILVCVLITYVLSREFHKETRPYIEIIEKDPLRAFTNFTLSVNRLSNCSFSLRAPYFSNITSVNVVPSAKFSVYFLQPGNFNITLICGDLFDIYCVKIHPAEYFIKNSSNSLLMPGSIGQNFNTSAIPIVRKLQSNSSGVPKLIKIEIPTKIYSFFDYVFTAYVYAKNEFLYYNICSLNFNDLDGENEIFVETSNGVANFTAFVAKCDNFSLQTSCEGITGNTLVRVKQLILKFDDPTDVISNTEMFNLTIGIYDDMNTLLNNTNNQNGYNLKLRYTVNDKIIVLKEGSFDHPESGKLTIKELRVYHFGPIKIEITGNVKTLNCQLVGTNLTINVKNSFSILPTIDSIINKPLYQANLTATIISLSSSIDINIYNFSFDLKCQGASIIKSISVLSNTTWTLYFNDLQNTNCLINASSPSGFEDIYYTADYIYAFDISQSVDNTSLCNISFSGGCVNCKPNSCKVNGSECMCIPNSGNLNSPSGCNCYPGYKEVYQNCSVNTMTGKRENCSFVDTCPEIADGCEVQYKKHQNPNNYTICKKYCEQWGRYYRNDEVSFAYSRDFMKIIVKFDRALNDTLLSKCELAFIDLKTDLKSNFTCNVISANTIHLSFPKQVYKTNLTLNINPNLVFSTEGDLYFIEALKKNSDFVEIPRPLDSLEIITESKGTCNMVRYFAYTRAVSYDYVYMWKINGSETNTTVPKLELNYEGNNTIELSIYSQTFNSVTVMKQNFSIYESQEIKIAFTSGSIINIKRGAQLELKIMIIENCGYFGAMLYEWDCSLCESACKDVENRTDLKTVDTSEIKNRECTVMVKASENSTESHYSGKTTVKINIIENEIELSLSRNSGKIQLADFNLDARITSYVKDSSIVNIKAECFNRKKKCLTSNGEQYLQTKKHSRNFYSFGIKQELLNLNEIYTIEITATVDNKSTSVKIDAEVSSMLVDIALPLQKQLINNDKEFLLIPTYNGNLTDVSFQWTIQPSLHQFDLNLHSSILVLPPNSLNFDIEYFISVKALSMSDIIMGTASVYIFRASPPYCKDITANWISDTYSNNSLYTKKVQVNSYCVDLNSNGLLFFQYGFKSDKEVIWAIKKSLSSIHNLRVPNTAKFLVYRICNEEDICINGEIIIDNKNNSDKETDEAKLISQFYNDTQDSHYTPNALISYIDMFHNITYIQNISYATKTYFQNELIENSALLTSLGCEKLIFLRFQELNESNYDIIKSINETYTAYKHRNTQEKLNLTTEIVNKTFDIIELAWNSSYYNSALDFLYEFQLDVANSLPFQTKYIFEKNLTVFAALIEGFSIHETIDMMYSEININSDSLNDTLIYQVIYFRYFNISIEMISFSITAVGYISQSTPILCRNTSESSRSLQKADQSPDTESCSGINQNFNFSAKIRLFRNYDEKSTYSCTNIKTYHKNSCNFSSNSLGFIEATISENGTFIIEKIWLKHITKYITVIFMASVILMTIVFCIYLHRADNKGYYVLNNRLMFISVHPFMSIFFPQVPKRRMAALLLMVASESMLMMFLGLFQLKFTKSNKPDVNEYYLSFNELNEWKVPWVLTQFLITLLYIFYLTTYTSFRIKMCFIYVCFFIIMISASIVAYVNFSYNDGTLNLWAKTFFIFCTFDLGVMHCLYSLLTVYLLTAKKLNKVHTITGLVQESTNK